MSRTMLKNYKMGLISYDDLLRTTGQFFNATHEWDSLTKRNIKEVLEYLGEDPKDYVIESQYPSVINSANSDDMNISALTTIMRVLYVNVYKVDIMVVGCVAIGFTHNHFTNE